MEVMDFDTPAEFNANQRRQTRDALLSDSDWTQMPDSPLTQEQKQKH